ncbi:RNase H domain-containing protein [Trichonephila clavipes]|uniref:RNase H domain-containing protein n=1 Tax=Trichonephila clavipes TaxID=2585209 RepID=A0A8X6WGQ9_TRICX|nr:RNase H domain-containing protein [Trichonephila clavipes]
MLKRLPVGMMWKLGEGVSSQVSSTSLDHGSKLRGPSPKPVESLNREKRLTHSSQKILELTDFSLLRFEGNEFANTLAKAGACEVPEPSAALTFLEIFFRTKHQNKTAWITPPRAPLVSMFSSWRLSGSRFYKTGSNASSEPATPAHILECLGLTKRDLAGVLLLVLNFLKVYDVMDQV